VRTKLLIAAAALFVACLSLANAQDAVDAFYSGVYLGMPIDDRIAYYLSGNPPIAKSRVQDVGF
jgi:hypothetical protein